MLTSAIALLVLVAGASAAAIQQEPIPILSQTQELNPDGTFRSAYETGNGIYRQEQGLVTNRGQKDESSVIEGVAKWTSPEGIPIELRWFAGPDGVVFEGAHLPIPPPAQEIPVAIQRSLDWNAAHPWKEPAEDKKL